MNKKNIINKTVSLGNYLCSVDGDTVFDLMQLVYRDNGYGDKLERWGASGTVFYTKDEQLAKQAKEISYSSDLEKTKEFLNNNKDHIYSLQDLYTNGLKLMNDKEFHAFKHLSTPELCKDTLKNNTYGCAHLIQDDKILIFYQNHMPIREFCNNKNLNIQKNYHEAQNALLKAYSAGKIEPDGQFTGGAVDKVMNSLLDINFINLSKYQKEMVLLLTEFNNNILVDTKFHTQIEKNKHIATFSQGKKTVKVEIPETKEQDFVVSCDGQIENIRKISKLLSYINNEIAQEKVNTFLKRKKM